MTDARVIVIGAGAAGLMAAITAARRGASVVVLERMAAPGRKLMITGKGRCNITNTCPVPEFLRNLPGNGKFLQGALHRFTNEDVMNLLEENGLPLVRERGGRVFPASGKAKDVIDTFLRMLREAGGRLETNCQATGLVFRSGSVAGVRYRRVEDDGRREGQDYRSPSERRETLGPEHTLDAEAVIVCTGGASYPGTGSDGNFVPILEKLGHTVEPLLPALVPLQPEEGFLEGLEGLALRNVRATLRDSGKAVESEFGELQFLRGTVAGPIALTLSRKAARLVHFGNRGLELEIDLKPALDEEKLDARILRDFQEDGKRPLAEALRKLVPQPLVETLLDLSYLDGAKAVSQVSKEERHTLREVLKHFTIPLTGTLPLAAAIVTAGGVSLKEINPKDMSSLLAPGLYFAGEVMDVDGYTGGFNLQAAFSSGHAAGEAAADRALDAVR